MKPTSALDVWLAKQRKKDMRATYVEAAALSRRMGSYVLMRLRYGLFNNALAIGIYLLELIALRRSYYSRHLLAAFAIHTLSVTAVAFFWGAQDRLRADVRRYRMDRSWGLLSSTIDTWTTGTVLLAVSVVISAAISLPIVWKLAPKWLPVALYAGGCVLRFAIGIVVRTYHSAVYALRRVRRPLWSMRVADAVGLAILFASSTRSPHLQAARISAAAIASAIVSLVYIRRVWRKLDLPSPKLAPRRALLGATGRGTGTLVLAGFGGAILRASHVLSLLAVTATASVGGFYQSSALLYIVSPFAAAAASWPAVLYFDLARLAVRPADDAVREDLLRRVRLIAPVLGIVFGGLAVLVIRLLRYDTSGVPVAFIIPLTLACSLFTVEQMGDFSCERYGRAALRVAPLALAAMTSALLRYILRGSLLDYVAFALVILGVTLGAWPSQRSLRHRSPEKTPLPLGLWLDALDRGGTIGCASIARRPGDPNVDVTCHVLASRLANRGCIVSVVLGRVLWVVPKGIAAPSAIEIAVAAGGRAAKVTQVEGEGLNRDAKRAQVRTWLLPSTSDTTVTDIAASFHALCPDGVRLGVPGGNGAAALTMAEQCAVYRAGSDVVSGKKPRARLRSVDVTAFAPEGRVRDLFVMPRTTPTDARAKINALVVAATLDHPREKKT